MPPRGPSPHGQHGDVREGPGRLAWGLALLVVVAAIAVGASLTASAGAQTGGGPMTGGGNAPVKPRITKVRCVAACASRRRAKAGSTLRLSGRGLDRVQGVTFHGGPGRRDDRVARPGSRLPSRLRVRVPANAEAGPISVALSPTVRSRRTRTIAILPPLPADPTPVLTAGSGPRARGAPAVETAVSRNRLYHSGRGLRFLYRVRHSAPVSVNVELVRSDGLVVYRWSPPPAQPGVVNTVVWRGTLGGRPAPVGGYAFRLTASSSSGAMARSAAVATPPTRDAFEVRDHIFPVRGRHNFVQSGARFGAGRSGHSHQGQDVMAKCGTRLVAARGGRIKHKAYQSSAGYYLVIDGSGTGVDYFYAHMAGPSPFSRGDRVVSGQQIGRVGESGNARGCHLHFEMWNAPGWYDGGRPFNPLGSLRAWDAYS